MLGILSAYSISYLVHLIWKINDILICQGEFADSVPIWYIYALSS